MLASEERAKRTQTLLRDTEEQVDLKLHKLEVEKSNHAAEIEELKETWMSVTSEREQVAMLREDHDAWLLREQE